MSVANAAGVVSGFLGPALSFFSIGPTRSFGGITGYITISENAVDALEITQQPVQQGAAVSDHAFKKPITLSIQIQFKSANIISLVSGTSMSLAQTYQSLLALQTPIPPNTLETFSVVTPKRTYANMLLATLGQTTDKKTENVLSITCTFQEVIMAPVAGTIVPRKQLSRPGSNGGTQKAGELSSFLYKGNQAIGALRGA